jgi:hypothetical protein
VAPARQGGAASRRPRTRQALPLLLFSMAAGRPTACSAHTVTRALIVA